MNRVNEQAQKSVSNILGSQAIDRYAMLTSILNFGYFEWYFQISMQKKSITILYNVSTLVS